MVYKLNENYGVLMLFFIDKWHGMNISDYLLYSNGTDYIKQFYDHFHLDYKTDWNNRVDSRKFRFYNFFTNQAISADSILVHRQPRVMSCDYGLDNRKECSNLSCLARIKLHVCVSNKFNIWVKDIEDSPGTRFSSNYIHALNIEILHHQKLNLFPFIKYIYREFTENNYKQFIEEFIRDFHIYDDELIKLFNFDTKHDYNMFNLSNFQNVLKPQQLNTTTNPLPIDIRYSILKNSDEQNKMTVQSFLFNYFHDYLLTKDFLTPPNLESSKLLDLLMQIYLQYPNYDLNDLLNSFCLDEKQKNIFIDSRFGRININDTNLICNISQIPGLDHRQKTFLHLLLRIPHFFIFCILVVFSDKIKILQKDVRFIKKNIEINKDSLLKIYSSLFTNVNNPGGKKITHYKNMLDWLFYLKLIEKKNTDYIPSYYIQELLLTGHNIIKFQLVPEKIMAKIKSIIENQVSL